MDRRDDSWRERGLGRQLVWVADSATICCRRLRKRSACVSALYGDQGAEFRNAPRHSKGGVAASHTVFQHSPMQILLSVEKAEHGKTCVRPQQNCDGAHKTSDARGTTSNSTKLVRSLEVVSSWQSGWGQGGRRERVESRHCTRPHRDRVVREQRNKGPVLTTVAALGKREPVSVPTLPRLARLSTNARLCLTGQPSVALRPVIFECDFANHSAF